MKDRLIDRPPTIGDYRRQGVVALQVRCARPCKHIGRVTFDALRLPDHTIVRTIPTLRRLRCAQCDRCVPDIVPILPAPEAPASGRADTAAARWTVITREATGGEGTSSPLWSRTHALRFVEEMEAAGIEVLRVEGPGGEVINTRDGDLPG